MLFRKHCNCVNKKRANVILEMPFMGFKNLINRHFSQNTYFDYEKSKISCLIIYKILNNRQYIYNL